MLPGWTLWIINLTLIWIGGGESSEQHHLGLPSRVFKHRFPESTPNVEYYSITEYPHCVNALRCGVKQSLAFPVFQSSTQRCVGVFEVVTPMETFKYSFLICGYYFRTQICEDFENKGLKCSIAFEHMDMELDENENEARTIALDEIKNVLKIVCDVNDLPLAQAWVPCKVGWPYRALVDGGILGVSCHYNKHDYAEFQLANNVHHFKEGVGVVGKALSSNNMVFCRDVTQLSLTEYPLAHYAREFGLSGCFAICLQSSCTGNDVYVLEFFMPVSNETNENPHTSLRKILETMRESFQTFRVASGEELGEELRTEEIDFQNGGELDSVQRPRPTISLPWPEPLRIEVEVMQVAASDQQLVNAINIGSNVGGTERNNIAITCTCLQEKSTSKASKRKGNKSGGTVNASIRKGNKSRGTVKASKRKGNKSGVKIKISLEDILQTSKMKLKDAAKKLQVSKSTLKRACRVYGIDRWPPRNIKKSGHSPLNESALCVDHEQSSQLNSDHLPSAQPLATTVYTKPHDTMMQDANIVTIKAKYGKDVTMKFHLSLSSRFVELQQEVTKRLNLDAGTYSVKYEDKDEDGELILMACDEDLQNCRRVSRLPGCTSIVVFVEPKVVYKPLNSLNR
ncbi:hypothetical protein ACSBR2_022875 [Camellia fascicularis]